MNPITRHSVVVAGMVTALLVFPSFVHAGIISIQNVQSCNVNGLDSSLNSVQGGVHCDNGLPFSLSGILDGSIALLVGNDKTPSWNIKNDTGVELDTLTLFYSGALASNSSIDMQMKGTNVFTSCETTAAGLVRLDVGCGTGDKTVDGPSMVKLVWSGGPGVADGGVFNLGTASFAHAGQDAGCFSGTANCRPNNNSQEVSAVPEPASLVLLGSGLLGLAAMARRRTQKQ